MRATSDVPYEALTEPGGEPGFAGAGGPDRSDEGLHYGRAWHRYKYCYRRAEPLRVLVAGCGTGRAAVWAARLNPGARVLGVDASAAAMGFARERAETVGLGGAVAFRAHDLAGPWPAGWGRFDFVVCRGVLGRAADPPRLLAALAEALDPEGLLLVTLPSRAGRQAAYALRQAVAALSPPGAGPAERLGLAREIFHALRPDHPVRARVGRLPQPATTADVERLLAGYLDDRHEWTLDEAAGMLARAGLTLLYAATPWPWRPDRVFAPGALTDRLRSGVERLDPSHLGRLIEALDPTLLDDECQLYACPAAYTPPAPSWPATRLDDPAGFDRLVPELTGLALTDAAAIRAAPGRRIAYQTLSGTRGELDRLSGLLLADVDGTTPCGAIDRKFASRTRASDDLDARQSRWIGLADAGLILLRPPGA
jgi:SAM-dependent methyltransferase